MDVFLEIHRGLPQEGPGSDACTLKALSAIPDLPPKPSILDVGCGPGRQTLTLARESHGLVTAVDNHQPYLDELRARAEKQRLAGSIITERHSMDDMSFEEASFDVVWAEGSIYVIGFREGLSYWRRFLHSNGCAAVTELCWLVDSPPDEVARFFRDAYPSMQPVAVNLNTIEECGYSVVKKFPLPESAWWKGYYGPMERRISDLRDKYASDAGALEVLEQEQKEIDLFRLYSDTYGYVFFVMRKAP